MADALSSRSAMQGVWLAVGLTIVVTLGLMTYEELASGWHPAREKPPVFDSWHWIRILTSLGLGGLLVSTLVTAKDNTEPLTPLSSAWRLAAWAILGLTGLFTAILITDPALFHDWSIEDRALEWVSVWLLFAASTMFVGKFWRVSRNRFAISRPRLQLLAAAGFAALFFLMAMEEVSWFQRQIGFETPAGMAEHNWQGEFNLHNFQTDITELGLYAGTGFFLLLLPLVRETIGGNWVVAPFRDLLPDRTVAAVSAPMLVFTYGHWNLLPVQLAFWTGLFACIYWSLRAMRRGRRAEAILFGALAAGVAFGQLLVLMFGHRMIEIFDATEFREFFLALGLAVYAWRQWHGTSRAS
jgi:hypothetical protein